MSAADLRPPVPFGRPVLFLFDAAGECRFQVHARPESDRDGVDAVSELAVLALVSGLPQAALLVPSRMRDLHDDAVISRPLVTTRAERLADGRIELDATAVLLGDDDTEPGASTAHALDPALSPVGSLLCDALLTTDVDLRVEDVAAVLRSWGHVVLAPPPGLPDVDHAALGRVRSRVHRLALELARRHRPVALAVDARRPAAPANLPVGFVPACPL